MFKALIGILRRFENFYGFFIVTTFFREVLDVLEVKFKALFLTQM